jgi:excisionase family DNA binding protein
MDELLSVVQAAKLLNISRWTIHSWMSKGKLVRTKVGRRTMVRHSALMMMVEDGGKSPAPKRKKL